MSTERIMPRVLVLCIDSEGSPSFHNCYPNVTPDEMIEGVHYDKAKQSAKESGYADPMIAFDATDRAARQLLAMHNWMYPEEPTGTPDTH